MTPGKTGELVGQMLGDYQLLSLLGAGGMAEVYRGYDVSLGREVAVKVLPAWLASDPGYVERFRSEARSVATLDHPNVVPVYQFGEERGLLYLVMPVLTESLRDRMQRETVLPPSDAARLVVQVAAALDAAHANGIVHRDVKPENILLTAEGKAQLTDFGIAREVSFLREAGQARTLAATGLPVGTPEYMAPEQLRGTAVDQRADIYALGAVLYEALTGVVPHEAPTAYEVAALVLTSPLTPPSTRNPAIWPELEAVVVRSLASDPADRYPDARRFALALRSAAMSRDSRMSRITMPASAEMLAAVRDNPPVTKKPSPADAATVAGAVGGSGGFDERAWASRGDWRNRHWGERFQQRKLSRPAGLAVTTLLVVAVLAICSGSGFAVLRGISALNSGTSLSPFIGDNSATATLTGDATAAGATATAAALAADTTPGARATATAGAHATATAGPGATAVPGATASPGVPTLTTVPTPTITPTPLPLVFGNIVLNSSNCFGSGTVTNVSTSTITWQWTVISPNTPSGFTWYSSSFFQQKGLPNDSKGLAPSASPETFYVHDSSCTGHPTYTVTIKDGQNNVYTITMA